MMGVAKLIVLTSAASLSWGCSDLRESHARSYEEAKAQGQLERGWLPSCLPPTARDIQEAHDLDTNDQWISFSGPSDLTDRWRRLAATSIGALPVRRPRGITWWPDELSSGEKAAVSKRSIFEQSDRGRTCWLSPADTRTFCWCTGTH